MGYLTQQIADEVGRLTQERGRQYFLRGAVENIEGDNLSITAVVRGTMRYHVQIKNLDEFIDYSCSCPYFERDFEPCKHIWAAALKAEQQGYLRRHGNFMSMHRLAALPGSLSAKSDALKRPPAPLSWKKQLAPLLEALAARES